MKKILFIIWSYTYGGGAEALLTMIVNHLNPKKYDISIIEYEHADYKVEPVNPNIKVLPPIERVETPDGQKKGYQAYYTPEVLTEKYIKGDYDLYISFNYQIPTFLLPKGEKNIAWIHTDVYCLAEKSAQRERRLQDEAFYKVSKIVAISDRTMKSLQELFPNHREKLVQIVNGIDIDFVREKAMHKTDIKLERPSVLFMGRLDDNKDPVRLLKVFQILSKKRNIHFYFLGEGIMRAAMEHMINVMGVEENIHLLGYQSNPFPVLRQADIVCQLSKSEGFSMSLMEAVSLGIPFISTPVGGAETLSYGETCGKIVETDEQAAQAVLELLEADRQKIAAACDQSIQRFGLDLYMKQIEDLFDEVLGEKQNEK